MMVQLGLHLIFILMTVELAIVLTNYFRYVIQTGSDLKIVEQPFGMYVFESAL